MCSTNDKLKLHDGVSYRDASYAGEVSNEYNSFGNLNTPSAYGTKLRNIFLTDNGDVPRHGGRRSRQESNLRRRIYDAWNVLKAASIIVE